MPLSWSSEHNWIFSHQILQQKVNWNVIKRKGPNELTGRYFRIISHSPISTNIPWYVCKIDKSNSLFLFTMMLFHRVTYSFLFLETVNPVNSRAWSEWISKQTLIPCIGDAALSCRAPLRCSYSTNLSLQKLHTLVCKNQCLITEFFTYLFSAELNNSAEVDNLSKCLYFEFHCYGSVPSLSLQAVTHAPVDQQ